MHDTRSEVVSIVRMKENRFLIVLYLHSVVLEHGLCLYGNLYIAVQTQSMLHILYLILM